MQQALFALHLEAAARHRLWQATVARRAVTATDESDHVKVLHPTKGYRYVHKRRLGLPVAKPQ